jgi:HSP90 family molecular chaperone
MERFGMGRQDPGVNLYSRKVLIKPKCAEILPEWLRFIKGVVDSEDIPLNISRENMQDSLLVQKINRALTKRVIKHLDDIAKKETGKYNEFWDEFGVFLKEGICRDYQHKDDVGKLLRFDSSIEGKTHTSLDDYIGRMPPEQSVIYFLNAPNRQFALNSPYYETFQAKGTEVLFLYNHIDDFVMSNLGTYQKRKLENVESANVNLATDAEKEEEKKRHEDADVKRKEEELVLYFKTVLSDRVATVKVTTRLKTTPAIVVGHDSAAVRKMMQYVDQQTGGTSIEKLPKQKLEVNPNHPIMEKILALKDTQPDLTKLITEQVFDNALIAADLLDSPRSMLGRLTTIMERALAK